MGRRAPASLVVVALTCLVALWGAAVASAEPIAMSNEEKQERLLDILEAFVPRAEEFWRESDIDVPDTGYFRAEGPGVDRTRGQGNVAFDYATLLVGRPHQQSFAGVPRAVIWDHLRKQIRYVAYTNRYYQPGGWGAVNQAAFKAYLTGWAAYVVWDQLDEDTQEAVANVVAHEADHFLARYPGQYVPGNTQSEENAWNSSLLAFAAAAFPDHPHAEAWDRHAKLYAINSATRPSDAWSEEMIDGQPLWQWVEGWNLFEDFTLENHGFIHPVYSQGSYHNLAEDAFFYEYAGKPPAQAFSFRLAEVWDEFLGWLIADDGDIVMPGGTDWTRHDYQHVGYLAYVASELQRADASVAESRAIDLLAHRQAATGNGSLFGQSQLGYEADVARYVAGAWWIHELLQSTPQSTREEYEQARARFAGLRYLPAREVIIANQRDALVTMLWSDENRGRPMAMVVPRARGYDDDPILMSYEHGSSLGSPGGAVGDWSCDCREEDGFFSTAGTIGSRRFSLTSFPDGTVMLLDRGSGATFVYGFAAIPGMTGTRPVHHAGGTYHADGGDPVDLDGEWANVADRFGLVVKGGAGIEAEHIPEEDPRIVLRGSKDTGTGNRGAVVLPLADRASTAEVADHTRQPETPEEWSALQATGTDHSERLVVARWGGPDGIELELTGERGAPIFTRQTTVDGDVGTLRLALGSPASTGFETRFFLRSDGPVHATLTDDGYLRIENPRAEEVEVEVTYVAEDGTASSATAALAPGRSALAVEAEGELAVVDASWRPLAQALAELEALEERLAEWRATEELDDGELDRLESVTGSTKAEVAGAIASLRAQPPQLAQAAERLGRARAEGRGIVSRGGPDEVREEIDAAGERIRELLRLARKRGLAVVGRIAEVEPFLPGEQREVDITLTNQDAGPVEDVRLRVIAPRGWQAPEQQLELGDLDAGASSEASFALRAPMDAQPGGERLVVKVSWRRDGERAATTAARELEVARAVSAEVQQTELPLARYGWNRAVVAYTNHAPEPVELELETKTGDPAVSAELEAETLQIDAGATEEVGVELRNAARIAGRTTLTVAARASTGQRLRNRVSLVHSDNVARNGIGAPWPAAFSRMHEPEYPPELAFDADESTFWVACGTFCDDEIGPENPDWVGVDFGAPVTFDSVAISPRGTTRAPRDYRIEVSDDGEEWRTVLERVDAPETAHTVSFEPVTARFVRLFLTRGYRTDTLQIQEFSVFGAPEAADVVVSAVHPELRHAAGGWNRAEVVLRNESAGPVEVELEAEVDGPIAATLEQEAVTLAADSEDTVGVELRNPGVAAGESTLTVRARDAEGRSATTRIKLKHTDNLALNDTDAPWPAAFSRTHEEGFPPQLAFDGATSTFWVACGTTCDDEIGPDNPDWVGVDLGARVRVGEVDSRPRGTQYAPLDYRAEVSDDGEEWTAVVERTDAPTSEHTVTFEPVMARYVRLFVTRGNRPDTLQISEFRVRAGEGVAGPLALSPQSSSVNLAAGARNEVELTLTNDGAEPAEVDLKARVKAPVEAQLESDSVTVPAGGSVPVRVVLHNPSLVDGSSPLAIEADSGEGEPASALVTLMHASNLALNSTGGRWPQPFARTNEPGYEPELATDGVNSTFWVACGPFCGTEDYLSPENPDWLGVDFGFPTRVGEVTVRPRGSDYGPKNYLIQVSQDGEQWATVKEMRLAPRDPHTVEFEPTVARYLRLYITRSHHPAHPNETVQISELQVRPGFVRPANDRFADRRALEGEAVSEAFTNWDATAEPGEPDHDGEPASASVWFEWVATASGRAAVDTCESGFDTVLAVYSAEGGDADASLERLQAVASDDDGCGESDAGSRVVFGAERGTVYAIAVDGYSGAMGEGVLSIALEPDAPPPANDAFGQAQELEGAAIQVEGENVGATAEPGEPAHADSPAGASLWYAWTAPEDGIAELSLCESEFDTVLAVYTGSELRQLVEAAANDDGCGPGSEGSSLSFEARSGERYLIAVDGYSDPPDLRSRGGAFLLELELGPLPPPPPGEPPASGARVAKVALAKGLVRRLKARGGGVRALAPARRRGGAIQLPARSGKVAAKGVRLALAGGLRLRLQAGRRSVMLRGLELVVSGKRVRLDAKVAGRRIALARLRGVGAAPYDRATGRLNLLGRAQLTAAARRVLARKLGLRLPAGLGRLSFRGALEGA